MEHAQWNQWGSSCISCPIGTHQQLDGRGYGKLQLPIIYLEKLQWSFTKMQFIYNQRSSRTNFSEMPSDKFNKKSSLLDCFLRTAHQADVFFFLLKKKKKTHESSKTLWHLCNLRSIWTQLKIKNWKIL